MLIWSTVVAVVVRFNDHVIGNAVISLILMVCLIPCSYYCWSVHTCPVMP